MSIIHHPLSIVLSPHFDDAALSCGGLIHHIRQSGEQVRVLTLFAGTPSADQPLSPFAEAIHDEMGAPEAVVPLRKAEDRAAMDILGADVEWLGFLDCPYRGVPGQQRWYYETMAALLGGVHPEEEGVVAQLAAAVRERIGDARSCTVYAPLGVGDHVDHQLTHRAAWLLWDEGWDVAFYEDYPYADPGYDHPLDATHTSTLEGTLANIYQAPLIPRLIHLTETDLQAKIKSVMAYGSQLAFIFDDVSKITARMHDFAGQYETGVLAERYWVPER